MTATIKTDRVSVEMLEMALLLNKHKVLSAQNLGQIKALCSPPPVYPPERVAQNRIQMGKYGAQPIRLQGKLPQISSQLATNGSDGSGS